MMGTLEIMSAPTHYLNGQKPSLQEGSKLSQWRLGKNQTSVSPADEQPSSLGSQAHSSAGSDTDDSTHSGTNSQRQSPHFVAQQQQQLNSYEHCPILGGWNVNAKSFRPVSSSIGHAPSSQHCQSVVGDFTFPPPPIANSNYSAQSLTNQVESVNNQQHFVGGFHNQSTFVPTASQNRQKETIDPLGIGGAEIMGVWQDPNAGLKRWQTYTGTTVWGNPEERANLTIQRWHEFGEEECVEIMTRLDEMAKKVPSTVHGWGVLPTMDALPAPLQRVHTHQSTGIAQVQQHRPYPNHHHQQPQNFHQRRVLNPPSRPHAIEHAAALGHFASPSVGNAYQQQLQHNTFAQPQQMCGWTNNDGFAFGHHHQQQQQLRMGYALNNAPKMAPSVTPFHSVGGLIPTNGWMGGYEPMTNDGMDPNNVYSRVEPQLQHSSRNSALPSAHFPFSGTDCFASVPGTGTTNSIWCD